MVSLSRRVRPAPDITWLLALVVVMLAGGARSARADWLIIPFAGAGFGGETTSFLNLDAGVGGAKSVYGVGGVWLPDGLVGIEGEFFYAPSFFQNPDGNALLTSSHVSSFSGGLLVTLPLSVTRESLRPYAAAGLGTMHASADYSVDIYDQSSWFTALHVGGGAIGFLSPDVGLRFDLRHITSLNRVQDELLPGARSRLRFWRLTVGVAIRVG